MRDDISDALRRGLVDGCVRSDVDPATGAFLVVALLRGIDSQRLLDPDSVDLATAHSRVAELVRARFAPA